MRPLFGLHMPSYTYPGSPPEQLFDRTVELALAAESAGFDLVTVMDHYHQIAVVGREDEPMLEAYTTLGALAARTSRVRLATMVTGVTYRNPAMLAKIITTLDVISHGRAILGIGAAWNDSEHAAYGWEFPPVGERMDRLDETLTICRLMFTQERSTFEGRYYRVEGAINEPRPIQPGGPQILVGGGGERRTLRLVARHADISNWFGGLEDLRHKNEVLLRHCEAEGRDPSTILRTAMAPFVLARNERDAQALLDRMPPERRAMFSVATPEQGAEQLRAYMDIGMGGFIFRNAAVRTPEDVALVGELIALMF